MTSFIDAVWAIVWKDLRLERHTGQIMSLMVVFSLAAVVTFNLALQGNLAAVREVSVGLLWVTVLLAGTLGLNRSFSAEQENRSFEALLLAPISRTALYMGKVISIFLFTLTLELILLVVFTAFTNKPFWLPQVWGLLALGTAGYVMAGVLVTSMSIQTRAREVLLPVLLLPLTLPVVLSAASATAAYVANPATPWSEVSFQVSLVLFYDVLIFCAGWFTYPAVVEE